MATKNNPGRISKFLTRADKAIDGGIKKADEMLDEAVEFGHMTYDGAKKTRDESRRRVAKKAAKKTDGK
ncbi:hypothetical protein NKOR_04065 [Candidatus Nitrosopumilus koreensis AR1]|uniref:Uncharacterized protein n=1 Tax=Candidatus Nitrosopumilus koreensis AR1 TaxID=1229908 RepID=K0B3N2_9ARCH|nr:MULTISPECIES: hypothetical protein [Nitrosopumilus]AFS80703.1 hypothetical protein NKOR_04065 [Candidatus Nitrosopumilus koreensis AR1]